MGVQGSDCARPAMCCLRTLELVMVTTTMMRMMVLLMVLVTMIKKLSS